MEQKRTLWIIVAAGVFLLVVLGAACILYSPSNGSNPPSIASASVSKPQMVNPEWVQNSSETTGFDSVSIPVYDGETVSPDMQSSTRTNELTVYSDNTVIYDLNKKSTSGATTIDLNALRTSTEAQETIAQNPQNINITVNIPDKPEPKNVETKTAPASSENEQKSVKVAVQDTPKPAQKPAATSEKKTASVSKSPSPKPAPAPVKKADTVVAKVAEKKAEQYWVQAAAFSTKKTAENARSVLDDNKIPADIFTFKDDNGKVFYRVRVGPYTTKSEAEYWRTRIVKINEFSDGASYVTTN